MAIVRGAAGNARPNIVMVLTDDMSYPEIDVLTMPLFLARHAAESGWCDLVNLCLTTPVCGPSRGALYTGQRADHNGMPSQPNTHRHFDQTKSIQCALHGSGVKTGITGKFLNDWAGTATPETTDAYMPRFWDYLWCAWNNTSGSSPYLNYQALNTDGSVSTYGSTNDTATYSTDVTFAHAVDFVNTYADPAGPPIFLWCTPVAPHPQYTPAARHASAGVDPVPVRACDSQHDVSTQPGWIQSMGEFTTAAMNNLTGTLHHKARRCMKAVDEGLDSLIAALIAKGVYENTLFVFLSDNGSTWGRFWRMGSTNETAKGTNYPEVMQASCYIRWPGATGRSIPQLASSVDITATWYDLMGLTPPLTLDGVSLADLITGTSVVWPTAKEFTSQNPDTFVPKWYGLRSYNPSAPLGQRQITYTEYLDGGRELYAEDTDPDCTVNLAGNPSYSGIQSTAASALASLKAKSAGQRREAGRGRVGVGATERAKWKLAYGSMMVETTAYVG